MDARTAIANAEFAGIVGKRKTADAAKSNRRRHIRPCVREIDGAHFRPPCFVTPFRRTRRVFPTGFRNFSVDAVKRDDFDRTRFITSGSAQPATRLRVRFDRVSR